MIENRLTDLETKFSFQESQIEELQKTVHEQYLAIAQLEKSLKKLSEKLQGAADGGIDPSHVRPPHY